MATLSRRLEAFINDHGGLVPLKPCLVGRGYRGGGRLAGKGPGMVRRRDGQYLVERWIASTTHASWSRRDSGAGLSRLLGFRPSLELKTAIELMPEPLLGPRRIGATAALFPVLTKILDPFDPIGFHYHQTDAYVHGHPDRFVQDHCGKDEAYYFLPGPMGAWPYTHVGFHPHVTEAQLVEAMAGGREALLGLSPYFLQQPNTGFFVPAGMVHSPGTMLTLEVQQPSDVGGGFGLHAPADASAAQRQAAARSVFDEVDLDLCRQPDLLQCYTLCSQPVKPAIAGLDQWWIMPPQVTRKFSAKRLICTQPCTWSENDCLALFIWAGQGRINGQDVRSGCEFFVPYATAVGGLSLEPGAEEMEGFAVFAGAV